MLVEAVRGITKPERVLVEAMTVILEAIRALQGAVRASMRLYECL